MTSVVVEREKLPLDMLRWLEAEGLDQARTIGVVFSTDERGGIILQRMGDVDPTMMERVRAASVRYRSALERIRSFEWNTVSGFPERIERITTRSSEISPSDPGLNPFNTLPESVDSSPPATMLPTHLDVQLILARP